MGRFAATFSVLATLAVTPALAQSPNGFPGSSPDQYFLANAAFGGRAEVAGGEMAMDRGFSPAVREYGRWMMTDHSFADRLLRRHTAGAGMRAPLGMAPWQFQEMEWLSQFRGPEFDRRYLIVQVRDHMRIMAVFFDEARFGRVPALADYAREMLPVLEQHLNEARALEALLPQQVAQPLSPNNESARRRMNEEGAWRLEVEGGP